MRLNRPVYLNTLRWFLDSPARLVMAAVTALATYFIIGASAHVEINGVAQSLQLFSPGTLAAFGNKVLLVLAWVLGIGVVRREIKSGSLPLVLLRPLTRASYLLSKWAALATLNLAFLFFVHAVVLFKGGAGNYTGALLMLLLAQSVQVLALAAVLTFLSCVPFDLGELGVALLATVALWALGHYAGQLQWDWLDQLSTQAFHVLFPQITVNGPGMLGALTGAVQDADSLGSCFFNAGVTVAALAGAVALLARREFTYAETGG